MAGAAGIPFSEIASYLTFFEINDYEERLNYLTHIRALDNAYLDFNQKKSKEK